MDGDRGESPRGLIKMEITLGTIIMAASFLVAAAGWAYTVAGKTDQAGQDLKDLKTSMEQRFNKVDGRFDAIDAKIIVIPTQGQRVELLIKQHDDDMSRVVSLERHVSDMDRQAAAFMSATTAQLDALLHPSALPVRTTR